MAMHVTLNEYYHKYQDARPGTDYRREAAHTFFYMIARTDIETDKFIRILNVIVFENDDLNDQAERLLETISLNKDIKILNAKEHLPLLSVVAKIHLAQSSVFPLNNFNDEGDEKLSPKFRCVV